MITCTTQAYGKIVAGIWASIEESHELVEVDCQPILLYQRQKPSTNNTKPTFSVPGLKGELILLN
jgi:hypothetical protein